jgi:flagellar operon protein
MEMGSKIQLHRQPILPLRPLEKPAEKANKTKKDETPSFKEILQSKIFEKSGLKFSKHAQERLISRNINLNESDIVKINNAVDKAAEKGVRDSLILFNEVAFVISIKNRTVITAVDGENLKENVFTNIDGAVII